MSDKDFWAVRALCRTKECLVRVEVFVPADRQGEAIDTMKDIIKKAELEHVSGTFDTYLMPAPSDSPSETTQRHSEGENNGR